MRNKIKCIITNCFFYKVTSTPEIVTPKDCIGNPFDFLSSEVCYFTYFQLDRKGRTRIIDGTDGCAAEDLCGN